MVTTENDKLLEPPGPDSEFEVQSLSGISENEKFEKESTMFDDGDQFSVCFDLTRLTFAL